MAERDDGDMVTQAILALEPLQVLSDDATFTGAQVSAPAAMAESAIRTQQADLRDARRELAEAKAERDALRKLILDTVDELAAEHGYHNSANILELALAKLEAGGRCAYLFDDGPAHVGQCDKWVPSDRKHCHYHAAALAKQGDKAVTYCRDTASAALAKQEELRWEASDENHQIILSDKDRGW